MAGNSNSGRPRTPTEKLKTLGVYRADRHGDRGAEPQPEGEPIKPGWLTGLAGALWDSQVPGLVKTGVATSADTESLVLLCQCWELSQTAHKLHKDDQTDKAALAAWRASLQEFNKLAAAFGLRPAERSKLQVKEEKKTPAIATRSRA